MVPNADGSTMPTTTAAGSTKASRPSSGRISGWPIGLVACVCAVQVIESVVIDEQGVLFDVDAVRGHRSSLIAYYATASESGY